jgi:hypothetical protein
MLQLMTLPYKIQTAYQPTSNGQSGGADDDIAFNLPSGFAPASCYYVFHGSIKNRTKKCQISPKKPDKN